MRERQRYLHDGLATERAYLYWCRHFIRWSDLRHPRDMAQPGVEAFLAHRLQAGTYIRTVQDLLGHSDVSTTMIYRYVLKAVAGGAPSPLDTLV